MKTSPPLLIAMLWCACGPDAAPLDDEVDFTNFALRRLPDGIAPKGFHIVEYDKTATFDAIRPLSAQGPSPMLASQVRPAGLPSEQWAQNLSVTWYATGDAMANAIAAALSAPQGPARVMVDEIRLDSDAKLARCAYLMRTVYPQYRGRWGAYLVEGEAVAYSNLNDSIDALLDADAAIAVELYPAHSRYCQSGSTSAQRDAWLTGYFRGERGAFDFARFDWLGRRKVARQSASQLSILFGVTDAYMNRRNASKFLDRLFYVWANFSGSRSIMLASNGGPGAWKWDYPATTNLARDQEFADSYQHYSVLGRLSSRLGPVDCD